MCVCQPLRAIKGSRIFSLLAIGFQGLVSKHQQDKGNSAWQTLSTPNWRVEKSRQRLHR